MTVCIRLGTHGHQISMFERGWTDLEPGHPGDSNSSSPPTGKLSFGESAIGGGFGRHTSPTRLVMVPLLLTAAVVRKAEAPVVPLRSAPQSPP